MNLAEIQHRVAATIVSAAAGEHAHSFALDEPARDDLFARSARIGIYQVAYRERMLAALRDNFPIIHRVLGDDAMHALGVAYLAAHPSRRPSIRWFGDELATFLAEHPEHLAHPALVDLAKMEWSLRCAFDAADDAPLLASQLEGLAPELWPELRVSLHASVALIDLQWAVEPLWHALNDDEQAAPPEPKAHAHALLIWRNAIENGNLETQWRSLDADEADMLRACERGDSFAQMCAIAAHIHADQAPLRVAGLLRLWIGSGLLTAFTPSHTAGDITTRHSQT